VKTKGLLKQTTEDYSLDNGNSQNDIIMMQDELGEEDDE